MVFVACYLYSLYVMFVFSSILFGVLESNGYEHYLRLG